jgi:transposase
MNHLDDITVADLQRALDEVDGKTPAMRLLAAIAYKNGVTQTELAEWYGVERRTIYSWLKRLEEKPLAEAVRDDDRPGRPRRLSEREQNELEELLNGPPGEVGYDAPAWTPELVADLLAERFDVAYSLPSCRRLMKEAGLRYRRSRGAAADRDDGDDRGISAEWTPR